MICLCFTDSCLSDLTNRNRQPPDTGCCWWKRIVLESCSPTTFYRDNPASLVQLHAGETMFTIMLSRCFNKPLLTYWRLVCSRGSTRLCWACAHCSCRGVPVLVRCRPPQTRSHCLCRRGNSRGMPSPLLKKQQCNTIPTIPQFFHWMFFEHSDVSFVRIFLASPLLVKNSVRPLNFQISVNIPPVK